MSDQEGDANASMSARNSLATPNRSHDHSHDHSHSQRSDDVRLSSSDESDNQDTDSTALDVDLDDPVDPDEDISAGRWHFLSRYFDRWFQSSQYGDHPSSTSVDLAFHSFYVFLPYVSTVSDQENRFLQRLRDATELVGLMLQLDKDAWWYLRKIRKPWFREFFPSNYDPEKMVPKMTFVLHQRFGLGDEKLDSIQRLRYLLIDCARVEKAALQTKSGRNFLRTKLRILDKMDSDHRIRNFKIPIEFVLRPEKAKNPDMLRSYLLDVIELVAAVQSKSASGSYPFRLDEIKLFTYMEHVSDAHTELANLMSLDVPVTLRLRHSHQHISLPFAWSDFGWRANPFPSLVDHPAASSMPIHSLDSRDIHSSAELLSAVAFSSRLRRLEIEADDEMDPEESLTHAKWLAFALRSNPHLERLVLHNFQATHKTLDAMRSVVESNDPARLLSSVELSDEHAARPQWVTLKPDALIQTTESRGPQPFGQLNISCEHEFPLAQSRSSEIEFIVPGHAIGSTPTANVVSIRETNTAMYPESSNSLKSLVLNDAYFDHGTVPRFVRLFGQSLDELRWTDNVGGALDQDLHEILVACPMLLRLSLQGSSLQSIASLSQHYENPGSQLQTISLAHTSVPMADLVAFFERLGDETTRMAQTLERFSYYCPGYSLNQDAAEAALRMLSTNRHLESITLGIESRVYDDYEDRFQSERDVQIQVEQLPLPAKLAVCSVVQHYVKIDSPSVLAQLDRGCLTLIFEWFARSNFRRVRVIQAE